MKAVKQAGFTIIEIMLFLGVSGLLISGILVGVGTSINTQRYRDSVTSLQSTLQNQYSEVNNVISSRMDNICAGDTIPRGQSNCVVLGKYITSHDNGRVIRIWNVIGSDLVANLPSDDIDALKLYKIQVISPTDFVDYEIEWGTSLDSISGSAAKFSILILRSPSSGVARTFINNSAEVPVNQIGGMLSPNLFKNSAQLCVNSRGLAGNKKMAISVNANATGVSSVEILTDSNTCK